jgi:hypothetical protein
MFTKKEDTSPQSATSGARHSQSKIVHDKRDSILNTGHPAGWINHTTERENTALKGQDWHSEALFLFIVLLYSMFIGSRLLMSVRDDGSGYPPVLCVRHLLVWHVWFEYVGLCVVVSFQISFQRAHEVDVYNYFVVYGIIPDSVR